MRKKKEITLINLFHKWALEKRKTKRKKSTQKKKENASTWKRNNTWINDGHEKWDGEIKSKRGRRQSC
jgi:hypothetical protein